MARPFFFETLIFGGAGGESGSRYATREEALRGHALCVDVAIKQVEKGPMGLKEDMEDALRRAEAAIEHATWRKVPSPQEGSARAYEGSADGWRFTVIDFDISNQGFPPGSRGYDGAGVDQAKGVLHLTRELAEKAFKLAFAQTAT